MIENNKETKREKFKTQKHHIIPKYYYRQVNLEIDNSANNLINLLYKDHILAHYYLYFCSKNKKYKFSNQCALEHILGNYTSDTELRNFAENLNNYQVLYEESIKYRSEIMRNRVISDVTRQKISEANKGKKRSQEIKDKLSIAHKGISLPKSQETRDKLSKAHKGKKVSDETRKKISLAGKGRTSPNKGKIFSREYRNKLSLAHVGHKDSDETKKRKSEALKGKALNTVYINNGYITKRIDKNDLNYYLSCN